MTVEIKRENGGEKGIDAWLGGRCTRPESEQRSLGGCWPMPTKLVARC